MVDRTLESDAGPPDVQQLTVPEVVSGGRYRISTVIRTVIDLMSVIPWVQGYDDAVRVPEQAIQIVGVLLKRLFCMEVGRLNR